MDKDLTAWNRDKARINYYLTLPDHDASGKPRNYRSAALDAYPDLNAELVYWGLSSRLHKPEAGQYLDQFMRQNGWQDWPRFGAQVVYYYTLTGTNQDLALSRYPEVEASVAAFAQYMYEREPVFHTSQAQQIYGRLTGQDVSKLPVLSH